MKIRTVVVSVDGDAQFQSPIETVEIAPGDMVSYSDECDSDVLTLSLSADGQTMDVRVKARRSIHASAPQLVIGRRAICLTGAIVE